MYLLLLLAISFSFLFPLKNQALRTDRVDYVCESLVTAKIDAFKTLEALDLNFDDYLIGVNNTAKILCA